MNPINAYTTLEHPGRMRIESWPRWMRDSHGEWAETDPRWAQAAGGILRLTGAPYAASYNPATGEIALETGGKRRTLRFASIGARGTDRALLTSTPLASGIQRVAGDTLDLAPSNGLTPRLIAGPDQLRIVVDMSDAGAFARWRPGTASTLALRLDDSGERIGRIIRDDDREVIEGAGTLEERVSLDAVATPRALNLTLSLVEGAGCEDAFIYIITPNSNYGASAYLSVRDTSFRSLIRFDYSALPANAIVSEALLGIMEYSGTATMPLGIYSVLKPWVEAQVTYNSYSTGNSWATPGLGSGTDYTATATDTQAVVQSNWNIFDVTTDIPTFATWIVLYPPPSGPNATRANFRSSEYGTAAERPYMTIDYTLPGGGLFQQPFRQLFGKVFP